MAFIDVVVVLYLSLREEEMRKACALLLAFAATLGFFAGCRPAKDKESNWPKLRIGYLPIAAELPLFVAIEQGFLREEGISYTLTQFASSNELVNAATADRIDILAGAATNVVWDAGSVSNKRHLLFALNPYSDSNGHITDYLLVRSNSGINSVSQLRGKRIASFPGSVKVLVNLELERQNLPRTDYETIEMSPRDWQTSLQAGAIDAVVALEPNATQIMSDGVGRPLISGFYAKLMDNLPLSGHWIAADYFARSDKRQVAAFLRAYKRAIQFCRTDEGRAKVFLKQYANVREDILTKVNLNPWQMSDEINKKAVQDYANLLRANGALNSDTNTTVYLLPE